MLIDDGQNMLALGKLAQVARLTTTDLDVGTGRDAIDGASNELGRVRST